MPSFLCNSCHTFLLSVYFVVCFTGLAAGQVVAEIVIGRDIANIGLEVFKVKVECRMRSHELIDVKEVAVIIAVIMIRRLRICRFLDTRGLIFKKNESLAAKLH